MKIIYMGTPDFAVPCLKALCENGYDICCVVTQPDKPQGRKQILTPPEVKKTALELGLNVYQPATLKSDEVYDYLKSFKPDYIVVAAYGKLLPKRVLDLPKFACINVHGSLLPAYRGAAPIQRSVISGDKLTGVTTMLMGEGLDTGDILLKMEYEIGINETAGEVFDALAAASPSLLLETLEKYTKGEIEPVKQDESKATYAAMLTKEEALIDWSKSAEEIHNMIRGMCEWPTAYTYYEGKKMKIFTSRLTNEKTDKEAGKIKDDKKRILVSCGDSMLLDIVSVQLEGSKRTQADSFLLGHKINMLGK